jgi:hypothetical protein
MLVSFLTEARKISVETAVEVASQLYRELNDALFIRSGYEKPVTLVYAAKPDEATTLTPEMTPDAYYYVFNSTGKKGFFIISGDDRARPVLGYSTESSFDTMRLPANIKAWMDNYRDEIVSLVNENPDIPSDPQWQQLANGMPSLRSEKILYTASWDQDYPYNIQCPVLPGGKAITGCVATSMAIVMKYHADRGYRAYGTGSHSYNDDGRTYSVNFGSYDWANMPDRVEDFTADIQREAVARLMYHCAVSIESDFESDGTGSYNWNTSVALTSFFGFDGKLGYIKKGNYSDSDWKNLVRNEIDAERPVIYDGNGNIGTAGHSFLLTGYNDNDMYFFNWGWGGNYNGWYALSALTPAIGHNYSSSQGMVAGIQPATGELISNLRFANGRNQEVNPDGIVKTENGVSLNIHGGTIENRSYRSFAGSIGVALMNANGNIKEIIGRNDYCQFERGYAWVNSSRLVGDIYCTITTPYYASDRIRFVSSENGGQSWHTIYGTPGIAFEVPPVKNEEITVSPVRVFGTTGGITVNSPCTETVRVYSLTGRMLFEGVKQEGECRFNIQLPAGIVIVRGDNWGRKIGME